MKEIKLNKHGIYLFGKLDGVDYVEAGNGVDDKGKTFKYGNSIKLRFILISSVTKNLNGTDVIVQVPKIQQVTIPTSEVDLLKQFNKFSKDIGKDVLVPSSADENKAIKLLDVSGLIVVA